MVTFAVYALFGILSYILFYKRTHDAMNPFGFSLSLFLFAAGGSCLTLHPSQFPLSIETHLMITIAVIEIFIVGIITTKSLKKQNFQHGNLPKISSNYTFFMYIFVSTVFVLFITNWISGGKFTYISSDEYFDVKASYELSGFSRGGSYINQLLPYTAIFVGYDLLFNKASAKVKKVLEFIYIVVICLLIWFVFVSRGTLLIIILGLLYLFNIKYHLKAKQIALIFVIIAVGMAILMTVRLNIASSAFSGKTENVYFNTIYNYFCMSFQVFDKLVVHGSPYSIITSSWITLSKGLGLQENIVKLEYMVSFVNSRTFLYTFYHDLGIFGVVVYPTAVFALVGKLYKTARISKPEYHLFLAVIQKAIVVIFYGNYFFGSFSKELPYYATVVLLVLSYRIPKIRICSLKHKRMRLKIVQK